MPRMVNKGMTHLLGARLSATPAADKVDRRGAHANTSYVRVVVICQLVCEAGPLRLLTPTLHIRMRHITQRLTK